MSIVGAFLTGPLPRVAVYHRRQRQSSRFVAAYSSDNGTGSLYGEPVRQEPLLDRWLSSPQDFLAFGPRLSLGFIASLPELAGRLQAQAERLTVLSQDPRPLEEKGQAIIQEASAELAELVQRGAMLEADILVNVGQLVPEGVREALPDGVRGALEGSPNRVYATSSVSVIEVDVPMPPTTITANQTVAELVGLRSAVGELRETLAGLANNANPAEDGVLRLNVREARTSLTRRLAQLSPATFTTQGSVQVAIAEATDLLTEVDALTL